MQTQRSIPKRSYNYDWWLLFITLAICLIGVLLVSRSGNYSQTIFGDANYLYYRHITWLAIGLSVLAMFAILDYRYFRKYAVLFMLFGIGLGIVTLATNEVILGATATIYNGSVKTSLVITFCSVIYLALFASYQWQIIEYDSAIILIRIGALLGITGGLIYLMPDLSGAASLLLLGGVVLFLVGVDIKQITFLVVLSTLIFWLVIQISPTGYERVSTFLLGLRDPNQAPYHIRAAYNAISEGGSFGSLQPITSITIPSPFQDSNFASLVNQFGLAGGLILIALFAALAYRTYCIARNASDPFGSLLASIIGFNILLEALLHITVMLGMIPFAAAGLPLVTTSGTQIIITMAEIGILMNISAVKGKFRSDVDLRESDLADTSRIRQVIRSLLP